MDQIKTTTETIIAYSNDTWENLGEVTLYHRDYPNITGTLLFKMIPGLGKKFKVVCENKTYTLEKNRSGLFCVSSCNAYIRALDRYLYVEGFE